MTNNSPTTGRLSFTRTPLTWRTCALLLLLQTLVITRFAITSESLWIDEFGTQEIANAGSLSEWWSTFSSLPNANVQMPLYHFYMFCWSKLFGFSEYALRLANWPLFLVAGIVLLGAFRRAPVYALSVFIVSSLYPFLWYYLNEARPYIMMYLGAVLVTVSVVQLYLSARTPAQEFAPTPTLWLFTGGVLILAASSLLGLPWAGMSLGLAAYVLLSARYYNNRLVWRWAWQPLMVMSVVLSILVVFYGDTVLRGARATALYETNIQTLLFAGYELVGLTGLGPGRLALREAGVSALSGFIGQLLIAVVLIGTSFGVGVARSLRFVPRRDIFVFLVGVVVPVAFIVCIGYVAHWRVLGRHFIPLLPSLMLLIAYGISVSMQADVRHKMLAVATIAVLGVSAISLTAARHAKDDYRAAAGIALSALQSGMSVWWAASPAGARYYGLDLSSGCPPVAQPGGAAAFYVSNLKKRCFRELKMPGVVLLSKPDAFDRHGAITAIIRERGFHKAREFPAFTLWKNPRVGVSGPDA